jgi:hypothetical protein
MKGTLGDMHHSYMCIVIDFGAICSTNKLAITGGSFGSRFGFATTYNKYGQGGECEAVEKLVLHC